MDVKQLREDVRAERALKLVPATAALLNNPLT
jgi:hypothetical protein